MSDSYKLVEEKLTEWGLSKYLENFKHEEVDDGCFLILPAEGVTEVIKEVGPRYKFISLREKYLNSLQDPNQLDINLELDDDKNSVSSSKLNSLDTITKDVTSRPSKPASVASTSLSTSSGASSLQSQNRSTKVKEILNTTAAGRELLTQKILNNSSRNTLVEEIVLYYLNNSIKLDAAGFNSLSNQIVEIYEKESVSLYYIPAKDSRRAGGKLFHKYHNEKKSLKKEKERNKNSAEKTNKQNLNAVDANILLKSIALDDENQWKKSWKDTTLTRDKCSSIAEYFKKYPVLKTSLGASLLQIDFETANYVADPSILFKKWPIVAPAIVQYSQGIKACKESLSKYGDADLEVLAFILMPYLFKPSAFTNAQKSKARATAQEQADSFIIWIDSILAFNTRINLRKDALKKLGLHFQPVVVAVGTPNNILQVFVCIDDIKFEFTELISAVDFCFKSFFALDARYPEQGEAIWFFFQNFVYNIINRENNSVRVNEVITNIKTIIEELEKKNEEEIGELSDDSSTHSDKDDELSNSSHPESET